MLHQLLKRALWQARRMPGLPLWSGSALVWAYSTRSMHSWRCGFRHGINQADWFLARYPEIQREFSQFVRRDP